MNNLQFDSWLNLGTQKLKSKQNEEKSIFKKIWRSLENKGWEFMARSFQSSMKHASKDGGNNRKTMWKIQNLHLKPK